MKSLREAAALIDAAGIGLEIRYPGGGYTHVAPEDVEHFVTDAVGYWAEREGTHEQAAYWLQRENRPA